MKKLIPFLFLFLGCQNDPIKEVQTVSYYKDIRTNLCFVVSTVHDGYTASADNVYSSVPCSPEVERLIQK